MAPLDAMRQKITAPAEGIYLKDYYKYLGFSANYDAEPAAARAEATYAVLTQPKPYIYPEDRVLGSFRSMWGEPCGGKAEAEHAAKIVRSFGECTFITNYDHFAPDYGVFLQEGIGGRVERIRASMKAHAKEPQKLLFLQAMERSMLALSTMLIDHARAAEYEKEPHLRAAAAACRKVSWEKPETFLEALQLVWMTHLAFVYEGRYAMALGRMDQFLYPFYTHDVENGLIDREQATELLAMTLIKIGERRLLGGDDVVNIAIGGRRRDGTGGVNELSYCLLEAVRRCNIPGPNLSARLYEGIPDEFLDACLKVIGTGLGYPALMNDEVNIPALARHGYAIEDCRDYAMVGCIENFICGKQPPWSDGRYNTPKYIELALNNGYCMQTGMRLGPQTGIEFASMADFLQAVEKQMRFGAGEYMARFRNENERYNHARYTQPFLSCFCADCIGRALDVRDGGAVYPSVHGAGCMGIGTVADSLCAVDEMVFRRKACTLAQLRQALLDNFEGHEALQAQLLRLPKYGNDDDAVDQYAIWYVAKSAEVFDHYRTYDGGAIYIAMASNTANVPAGLEVAATPDGRKNAEPLSDAGSPMHGMDKKGPTAVFSSLSKPDYTLVACGSVLNQKYSPEMFQTPELRARLRAMIRAYFLAGGQEVQINSVSREMLMDAMAHPEKYESLVVRVSGFSAYFNHLSREIQQDILKRTEHAGA